AEAATTQAEESTSSLAMMAGFQLGPPRAGLIGPLQPSMAPIVVYTGPVKSPTALEQLASAPDRETKKRAQKSGTQAASTQATPAARRGAKPAAKTAAKPASGDAKVAPAKPAAAKPASAEPAAKPKPKPKPKPVAATQSKQ